MPDLCRMLVDDFLKNSWQSVKALVEALAEFKAENRNSVSLFRFKDNRRIDQEFEGNRFFLRASVEYSNPQLTVEEAQGIIGARLLQACTNHFFHNGLRQPDAGDAAQICELLGK